MKITICPKNLEALLSPYVGWTWRVDAAAFGGCLAVCAETKNLQIARRCEAQSNSPVARQQTSLLVNTLHEIATFGVRERLAQVEIDGRTVRCGNCEYELALSITDMKHTSISAAQASGWFRAEGKPAGSVDGNKLAGIDKGKQAALRLANEAYLLDADDTHALAGAISGAAEVRAVRGGVRLYSQDCSATLMTRLTVFEASSAAKTFVATSEAAGKLGIDPGRLQTACDNRHVPSYSIAGETMVDVSEIRALRSTDAKLGGLPELPGLSPRANHVLFFARVNSAEKLATMSDLDLSVTPNCGKKTLHEILHAADKAGIPIQRDSRLPKSLR